MNAITKCQALRIVNAENKMNILDFELVGKYQILYLKNDNLSFFKDFEPLKDKIHGEVVHYLDNIKIIIDTWS